MQNRHFCYALCVKHSQVREGLRYLSLRGTTDREESMPWLHITENPCVHLLEKKIKPMFTELELLLEHRKKWTTCLMTFGL